MRRYARRRLGRAGSRARYQPGEGCPDDRAGRRAIDKLRPVAQTFVVRDHRRPPDESLALRYSDFDGRSSAAHRRFRDRVTAWGRSVAARLGRLGLEFTVAVSRDAGAERLLLLGAASTTALSLDIDAAAVRVGFELQAALVRAAKARLAVGDEAVRLITALEQLPEQFVMAIAEDSASYVAPRTTPEQLRLLLERAERDGTPLWIGWTVPRDTALEHAVLLDEQLADALVALARVLLLFTGDAAGPAEETSSPAGRTSHAALDGVARDAPGPGRGRHRRHAQRARGGSSAHPKRDARRRGDPDDRELEHEGEAEIDRRRDSPSPSSLDQPVPRGAIPAVKMRLRYAPPIAETLAPIARGTRVRVLKGPFSGKVGLVSELDGKGGARVMLGLLAVRLNVEHLTPLAEGGRRPVLSTSHRKPAPVRS